MKKRKSRYLQRIMAMLLSAVLIAGMISNAAPITVMADASGTDWTLAADGTLTITSNAGMEDWVNNQATYMGQVKRAVIQNGVYSIGSNAFMSCSRLTEITIPEGVKSIGDRAFDGCGSLTEIKIPDSVERIEAGAFMNCGNLTKINIPEGVQSIGTYTFSNCSSLTKITIPKNVINISALAFDGCGSLTEVIMERETPPTLGSAVFADCGFVTGKTQGIHVPSGTAKDYQDAWTDWADYITDAAANIASGTDWTLAADGTLTITSDAGMADWVSNRATYMGLVKRAEIQNGVQSIGDSAFNGCTGLEKITIPESVTSIGNYAFNRCSLTNITIPKNVASIGTYAFNACSKLTEVIVERETPPTLASSVFADCGFVKDKAQGIHVPEGKEQDYKNSWTAWADYITDAAANIASGTDWTLAADGTLTIISDAGMADWVSNLGTYCKQVKSAEIQNGVQSIEDNAFYNCSGLTKITIPESVKTIKQVAFQNCSSLTEIKIPDSVESIGDGAFCDCSRLVKINIPEGVQSIGGNAFSNCSSLTEIKIPKNVTSIGSAAFTQCSKLTEVIMERETPPTLGSAVFANCGFVKDKAQGIHVPEGKAQDYKNSWTDWADYITDAAANIASGTDWTLAADGTMTITSDAGMADWVSNRATYCNQVKSAEIQNGVQSIGDNAFNDCSGLTKITIPEGVQSIGVDAFSNCSSLTEITIPEGVQSIGGYAFSYCSSLTKINIPEGVQHIQNDTFLNCSGLIEITIPESVQIIDSDAFSYCRSLTEITIPEGVQSIGGCAFSYCSSLTKITIPDSVQSIEGEAFYGCSSLTKITIPKNVASIGIGAFRECSKLTEVIMERETPPTLEIQVFYGCGFVTDNIQGIHVPEGKTQDYKNSWTAWADYITDAAANIASGTDWTLAADGTLTITSDAGMTDWGSNRATYKGQVKRAEIQNGVQSIGDNAFYYCSGLTEITIPEGVKSIGGTAFDGCSSLTEIKIPDSVESIEAGAFRDCNSLIKINIPEGVQSIGVSAFYGCRSLTKITIPKNVASIGNGAFMNCSKLTEVIMEGIVPPTLDIQVFDNCGFVTDNTQGIHVPSGTAKDYQDAWTDWSDYITDTAALDTQPPTGTIKIENNSWKSFLNIITFGLFFKDTKHVTIEAEDTGLGVDKIYYYISGEVLTEAQVKALGETDWTQGASFSVRPDRKCVIYAKITDMAGNMTYISSDGLVFDGTAPVITGVTDGETYNTPQEVTVTDANLESVTVNGKAVMLRDNTFSLGLADDQQTIVATDKAGNTTTVTVTVKETHTHDYGDWQHDKTQHWKVCTCGDETDRGNHDFGDWITDREATATEEGTKHRECQTCKYREEGTIPATGESHTHKYGDWKHDKTQHWKVCTCGDETGRANHDFGDWITDREATATEEGTKHRECQTCQYREEETIPATGESHTHDYGDWKHDKTQHWKVCTCGDEIDRGNHDFGEWITDSEATATEAGTKHRECQTCQYREEGTIPATGTELGSGTVIPEVRPGENAPATGISTPAEKLEDVLLTEAEKQQVLSGTDIRIVLEVQESESTISDLDKNSINQALNGFTVGQYLNIDLYKLIGEKRTDITETSEKIRIVITVPDTLKNTDGSVTRTFAVIRVHNGSVESLSDMDNSADTITIETDRFSTYSIVYKDVSNGDAPNTGDVTPIKLYATLAMIAGFVYLLLYFTNRKRVMTEKTEE